MHVADGLLPAPLCIGGYALGGLTLWWNLRRAKVQSAKRADVLSDGLAADGSTLSSARARHIDQNNLARNSRHSLQQNIARAALLTAAFFVASSVRIAIPPTSVHLVLVGLMGAILGPLAFPSVVVGLTLQAVLVGHGGLTVLGINSLILGWPAIAAGFLFRLCQRWGGGWLGRSRATMAGGFLAGAMGTSLAVLLFFSAVLLGITPDLNPEVEQAATIGIAIAHAPLVLVEGFFTAGVIGFCQRVYPDLLPDFLMARSVRSPY
ncbi:MAG: cobalt transporter CbiM [Cyanobacteria bacterium P01_D01_bin.73]